MSTEEKYKENGGVVKDDDFVETRCGIGNCRPSWLQRMNNPKILCLCICMYITVQGFAVNGINNVNTTSYERRFELNSSQVGWISSSFDIAASVFGIIIGFCGNRRHKARILNAAFIVAALGSLCMFLPHFLTGLYQWGQRTTKGTCDLIKDDTNDACDKEVSKLPNYLTMLIIGQMMHGIGGSTLITVGYSLMDDSVPAENAPLYFGLFGLCQAIGPTIGFIIGGVLLNVYVDYPQVSRENWELTPTDPRWVGGWWIGFFFSSILMFTLAMPFLFFGAELPTAKSVRESRVSQTHSDSDISPVRKLGESINIKEFPVSVLRLLRNPTFMCVCIGQAFTGLITLGLATFLPKYIQNTFDLTASRAAIIAGVVIVPGAAIGQFTGGLILRRWKFKVTGTLRFILVVIILALLSKLAFFIRCDKDKLVGWNAPYANSNKTGNLLSTCNAGCNCDTTQFRQVCDDIGNKYFSPCLAGCTEMENAKTFSECSCIANLNTNSSSVSAENCGQLEGQCNRPLILFIIIVFIGALMTSTHAAPALVVVLRCTHESERTLALGLLNFLGRFFGSIPGPLIYGAAIDSTCGIWGNNCGARGSCWVYDTSKMGTYLAILGFGFAALSVTFFFLAYKLYKPPKHADRTFVVTDINCVTASKETLPTEISNTEL